MHAQHDRHRGWNPFWAALGAALLVLVPLVGGTVLLSRQQLSRQLRQAARSQQGIAVQLPQERDRLTVLVCTAGEQPGLRTRPRHWPTATRRRGRPAADRH